MRSMIRIVALGHVLEALLEGFLGLVWITRDTTQHGDLDPITLAIVERTGVGFGFFLIGLAVARFIVALLNFDVRGRVPGLVVASLGVLQSVGCCCVPSGFALLVVALVVYLNPDAAEAFRMRAEGATASEALEGVSARHLADVFGDDDLAPPR